MAKPTKGVYVTRGRANELEKMIVEMRRDFGERIAAAEARAATAEERVTALYDTLVNALLNKQQTPRKVA